MPLYIRSWLWQISVIFKILSLSESARNMRQNCCNISCQTSKVCRHYLAKFKCSYVITLPLQQSQNILHSNLIFYLPHSYSIAYDRLSNYFACISLSVRLSVRTPTVAFRDRFSRKVVWRLKTQKVRKSSLGSTSDHPFSHYEPKTAAKGARICIFQPNYQRCKIAICWSHQTGLLRHCLGAYNPSRRLRGWSKTGE